MEAKLQRTSLSVTGNTYTICPAITLISEYQMNTLKTFRALSLIEGLSLVTLLFVALPLRNYLDINIVWPVGMTHGLLWLAYVVMSLVVSHRQKWSVLFWLLVLLVSVLPFGFLWLDTRLKREMSLSTT